MTELRVSVPMPPNTTNNGGRKSTHWRVLQREKKSYAKRLDELQNAGLIPPPPLLPFRKSVVTSRMFLGSAMDDDNALARHKQVLDWLKTRGYIVDDRKKNLTWHSFPEQVIGRKDVAYRIELVLREVVP